jgi:hypothetical protein
MAYHLVSNEVPFHLIKQRRLYFMKKSILVGQTLAIALLAIPLSSQAQSWTCKNGNNVREIIIQSESPSSPVPCSVIYKKTTEGAPDQTLWTAENDAGYCEEKAKAFVEKQTGWGWACEEAMSGASTEPAPASAPAPNN